MFALDKRRSDACQFGGTDIFGVNLGCPTDTVGAAAGAAFRRLHLRRPWFLRTFRGSEGMLNLATSRLPGEPNLRVSSIYITVCDTPRLASTPEASSSLIARGYGAGMMP